MSPKQTQYTDLPEAIPQQHPESEGLREHTEEKIPYYAARPTEGMMLVGEDQPEVRGSSQPKRRICGLAVWVFWALVAAIAVVVVVAAVVGGVVGTLSQKHTSSTPSQTTLPSSSATTSTSQTSTTASITTSTIPGPTGSTLLRDCPSSNQTIYTYTNNTTPMLFRKFCSAQFADSDGWASYPNTNTASLDECIDLCGAYNLQNETQIRAGSSHVCNAVSWRVTNADNWLGHCFGYTTRNLSGVFDVSAIEQSDSAVWINEDF